MPTESGSTGGKVANAAARTVAGGTARLFAAWSMTSPEPAAADRRCEGLADLARRQAVVSEAMFLTESATWALAAQWGNTVELPAGEFPPRNDMIYDGANCYLRLPAGWTGFFLGDPAGPRGSNDPLWPLDALFGANNDAVATGPAQVRGEPVTHYRLTVDLARADAALPAGVTVPQGPYRALAALPAEVWLDAAGRARRIAVSTGSVSHGSLVWSVVELWDFGLAADITVPQPEEVLSPADAYRLSEQEQPGPDA